MGADQGNAMLVALLGELAWSPSVLAETVNGLLGPCYIARSSAIRMDRRFFTAPAWAYADQLATRGGSSSRWLTPGGP